MSDMTMKDFPGYLDEKPFLCDVEGCANRFTNEDHLAVHKKRHEMVLNLGAGNKGNMFADQTPTPTRFIRNCEEVGLFQDLQNVNPFDETFRKAAEANKIGQITCLERNFLLNPTDDTLHTPNVFPHIPDLPCLDPRPDNTHLDNIQSQEEISKSTTNVQNTICLDPMATSQESEESGDKKVLTGQQESLISKGHKKRKNEKILSKEPKLVQSISPEKIPTTLQYDMVILKDINATSNNLIGTVKQKLHKSITDKKATVLQLKVPIPKAPVAIRNTSSRNNFSTFSKNSMKLITKMENSDANFTETKLGRRKKKDNYIQESRIEFLARNRAAATRCREKKKLYVSYLEKLNRELTEANQNLHTSNLSLKKQVAGLQTELLRHKNCNVADANTEAALNNHFKSVRKTAKGIAKGAGLDENSKTLGDVVQVKSSELLTARTEPGSVLVDYVEVTLDSNNEECPVPLAESNNPADLIARFDSNKDDNVSRLELDKLKDIGSVGENLQHVLNEHSYFTKQVQIGVSKKFVGQFKAKINPSGVNSSQIERVVNEGTNFRKIEPFPIALAPSTVVLQSPNPPPLLLLKPFKKRSITSKQTETL